MTLKFKPVTHVLFDLDGLLLNTEALYTIGTQNVLDKFFQNPRKLYSWDYKVILMGLKTEEVWKKIVEHFEIPITWQEYEKLAIEQFDVLMKDCVKLPGVDRLINHLHKHNIPFCLATSSSQESFDIKATHHQEFFNKFNHIVLGSSDSGVTRGKPFPDIFLVAASRFLNLPNPENCLVFEDSPNGVKSAQAAGMQVVMVPNPHVTENQLFIISATTSITFCDDVNSQLDSSESTKTAEKSFYGSYRWEEMRMNYVLPEDVVYGSQNAGLEPLFVVRGKSNNYNYFGKLPMPYSTRDAYLTNESREFATKDFHILTAKGYSWCRPNSFASSATIINPICRARYEGFLTPGTLANNKCRVGS